MANPAEPEAVTNAASNLKRQNSLVEPNRTEYKLDTHCTDNTQHDKYGTSFQTPSNGATKNLNQEKLIAIIDSKEHCIKELKSKVFQQSYSMDQMHHTLRSKDVEFKEKSDEYEQKIIDIEGKGQRCDALEQEITVKDVEHNELLEALHEKEEKLEKCNAQIQQLKHRIVDQSVPELRDQSAPKWVRSRSRPQSAVNHFGGFGSKINRAKTIKSRNQELNIEQKMFKELQTKLGQSNAHKQLILTFLKEIINITDRPQIQTEHISDSKPRQNNEDTDTPDTSGNGNDAENSEINCGQYWYNEAITMMENYPDLFERHLCSLKDKIMGNLETLNLRVLELTASRDQQLHDEQRKNKMIKKLKFEMKQFNGDHEDAHYGMFHGKDQQILSNMECMEHFILSEITFFESVWKSGARSISEHKKYLIEELKHQCTSIDIKWHKLLSALSASGEMERVRGDGDNQEITMVIRSGLDKLDDIKSKLKTHIKAMDQLLNRLRDAIVYLKQSMNSIVHSSGSMQSNATLQTSQIESVHGIALDHIDNDEEQCSEMVLLSSPKLTLIIGTITKCNQIHFRIGEAVAEYEKHSFLLQKHLYHINTLLSDAIHQSALRVQSLNISHRERDNWKYRNDRMERESGNISEDRLHHQIESILREKLNMKLMRSASSPQISSIAEGEEVDTPFDTRFDNRFDDKFENETSMQNITELLRQSTDHHRDRVKHHEDKSAFLSSSQISGDSTTIPSTQPFIVDDVANALNEPELESNRASEAASESVAESTSTVQQNVHREEEQNPRFITKGDLGACPERNSQRQRTLDNEDESVMQSEEPMFYDAPKSDNVERYILRKKREHKKLEKRLRKKTFLLQKCNDRLNALEKQEKLLLSKQKILRRRKTNEIKTINKQISNIIQRPNDHEASVQEMKRLGVKIIKERLRNRKDPKKQQRISKTMIEQMCARKERIKNKYSKQIKQLNATQTVTLKMEMQRAESERNMISMALRDLVDRFARTEHDVRNGIKLMQSDHRMTIGFAPADAYSHEKVQSERGPQTLQLKRNLPCSMMNSNDMVPTVGGMADIDRLFAENEHLRGIILNEVDDDRENDADFSLPRIPASAL